VVVRQSGEAIRTPRAIKDAFARDLPTTANLQTKPVDFATSGDLAYEVGTMTYVVERPGSAAEMKSAVYVMVMERQWDASWKIQSQMLSDPVAQQ
jgi:ketosteroid isomerase-like protein